MLMSLACSGPVMALDVSTILKDETSVYLMPAEITKDGKAYVYTYTTSNDDKETHSYSIYDDNFQLVKEFVTNIGTPDEYSYQSQERERVYRSLNLLYTDRISDALNINGSTEGLDIETVLDYVKGYYATAEIVSLEDGSQVIAYDFYDKEIYGNKYPYRFFKEVNGEWYEYRSQYEQTDYGPYGEWEEPKSHERITYPGLTYVEIMPLDGSDGSSFSLTRGIFSQDFNYILPEYKKVEFEKEYTWDSTDWVYRKEWGMKSVLSAYKVYDSSNKEVMSINIPEGYFAYGESLDFLRIGDKRYIMVSVRKERPGENGSDHFTIVYRLDNDAKITQVAIAPSTKISPRSPKRGEQVTVTLDTPAGMEGCRVQVISTSGQTMLSTKIPAGQSHFDIDTSGFSQGMYIVNVYGGGITKEAAKIIVR